LKRGEIAMLIEGSCHCGNLSFTLAWEPDPLEIPARACSCSFCSKHGGVWTSNRNGLLRVKIKDPALISRYTFATQSADFHVCSRCGVVPVVTSDVDGHLYAVVNVNAFTNLPAALLRHASASFDVETTASRLTRRQANWIADVQIIEDHA
jgi:hypothetical protein